MKDEIKNLRAIIQRKDEALRFRGQTEINWK
ncbi:hypothetical protein SAG0170_07470 [Streptococcus agalactiae LDS 617]|nr:hypothetical protein SAG0170_07470 [Streptococcus agalactiae LDS 617]